MQNIKSLFNFEPLATEEEIRAAAMQFVREMSGFNTPSGANEAAFYAAVDDIARISEQLLGSLESTCAGYLNHPLGVETASMAESG